MPGSETARIALLSPRLANQIAAGEVVERPASVLKELLENSLDAGATRIDIDLELGGMRKLSVTDNGLGIHHDDLALALARHATSKIHSLDDLCAVSSLGFRGEALASIASVSRLELSSRQRGADRAWSAFAEGAEMAVRLQPSSLPQGTRVEVRDLFFNTPGRRRFLRSESTEFTHLEDVARRIALAHPDCSFTLMHNGKRVRHWPRAASDSRIAAIMGQRFGALARPVDVRIDAIRLHGLVAPASEHKAQSDAQFVYVNGRGIRDRVVMHAIRSAYDDSIPAGRSPAYCLFVELPAAEVDVNVHPTKHEVRFRNARWMHDWLAACTRDALQTDAQDEVLSSLSPISAGTDLYESEAPAASVSQREASQERRAAQAKQGGQARQALFGSPKPAMPAQASVAEQWALYRLGDEPEQMARAEITFDNTDVSSDAVNRDSTASFRGATVHFLPERRCLLLLEIGRFMASSEQVLAHWWRTSAAGQPMKSLMFPVSISIADGFDEEQMTRMGQQLQQIVCHVERTPGSLRLLSAPWSYSGCVWAELMRELTGHDDAWRLLARHRIKQTEELGNDISKALSDWYGSLRCLPEEFRLVQTQHWQQLWDCL